VFQVLDERGKMIGKDPELDDERLLSLYRALITAREFDERCLHYQRIGRIPSYYPAAGMEAMAGAAYALHPQDWVVCSFREQPLRLARGIPITAELANFVNAPDHVWDAYEYRVTNKSPTIGTQLPHAVGMAYGARLQHRDEVVLAVTGDGGTSEGDFHAAMNFAGVWNAPVVFFCVNNQYAQSTPFSKQTATATVAEKAVAYGFEGVLVDGMDPLAVYQAVGRAVEKAHSGGGPTLVEILTYRFQAHSTYDGTPVYRTREEEAEWAAKDPLIRMGAFLQEKGILPDGFEQEVRSEIAAAVLEAVETLEGADQPDRSIPFRHMYAAPPVHLVEQLHEQQRIAGETPTQLASALVADTAESDGPTAKMTLVEGLGAALDHRMGTDERTVILGEDVAVEGGVFRVTNGLLERYGSERVIDTPLSEVGIMGTSVGMAIAGLRPVPELEFAGLGYSAFDQIVFHVARYRWRTRSRLKMPIVIRVPAGGGHQGGEGHSDSPEAYFAHAPGLTVVYPSNPYDAKGLMAAALESDDPIVFFEPIAQYFVKQDGIPTGHYTIPIGRARVVQEGSDLTMVTWGNPVRAAEEAAGALAGESISIELIDLRTIKPWDRETVLASVAKTGRLVVAHDGPVIGGFGAEISATVGERIGYDLEVPPVRVGHPDIPWGQPMYEPYSKMTPEVLIDAVRRVLEG
jgi:2-oxoisovalerate dehydrogenase E1 component